MRYGCAALLMLLSSTATAWAQADVHVTAPSARVVGGTVAGLQKKEARVNLDEVVARLMLFDANRDSKIAITELPERMQPLVARGDKSADLMLDATEIRKMAEVPPRVPVLFRSPQEGTYGFGDTSGTLSSRMHIENTIEDLKLAPRAAAEARRIGSAFADEIEGASFANIRKALAPLLDISQLAALEANLTGNGAGRVFQLAPAPSAGRNFVLSMGATRLMLQGPSEHMKAALSAVESFRTGTQLDDARRAELADRLSGVLTDEESESFRSALARRPIVKAAGAGSAPRAVRVVDSVPTLLEVVKLISR